MRNSFFFNDEDYDGIVLNIDRGFIATNPELKTALNAFTEALENCTCSTMMPSYSRNLNELKNYAQKKERLNEEKERQQRFKEQQEQELKNRLEHKTLPIIQDTATYTTSSDMLIISGKHYSDMYTKKCALKSEVTNAFAEFLKTSDMPMFLEFCRENGFYIDTKALTPFFNHKESYLYSNSYMCPTIKIKINRVEFYQRGTKNPSKIYFKSPILQWDLKQQQYYIQGDYSHNIKSVYAERDGETGSRMYLNDFEINKNNFVKKEQ